MNTGTALSPLCTVTHYEAVTDARGSRQATPMNPPADSKTLLEGVTLSHHDGVFRVSSRSPLRVLGSPNIGDDLALTRNIVAISPARELQQPEAEQHLHTWAIQAGIHEPYVGLLTSGSVDDFALVTESTPKWKMTVVVFADLSAPSSAGESMPLEEDAIGEIDIMILTDASLSMGAMVSAMVVATEAKVRTLMQRGLTTHEGYAATGAPADSVIIACLSKGERIRRAGATSRLGYLIGKSVHQGLSRVLDSNHAT